MATKKIASKKMHVKKGDTVVVIAGKDKGKKGNVLSSFPDKSKVLVEGVNMVKKHARASQHNPQGGILTQEAPIHVSNVLLADPKTGEATRIGKKLLGDGKKVRVAKKSGEAIDK